VLHHLLERLLTELGLMQDSMQGQQLLQRVHEAVTDLIRGKVSPGYCGHWVNKMFVMLVRCCSRAVGALHVMAGSRAAAGGTLTLRGQGDSCAAQQSQCPILH
jgi:hypothetical protein